MVQAPKSAIVAQPSVGEAKVRVPVAPAVCTAAPAVKGRLPTDVHEVPPSVPSTIRATPRWAPVGPASSAQTVPFRPVSARTGTPSADPLGVGSADGTAIQWLPPSVVCKTAPMQVFPVQLACPSQPTWAEVKYSAVMLPAFGSATVQCCPPSVVCRRTASCRWPGVGTAQLGSVSAGTATAQPFCVFSKVRANTALGPSYWVVHDVPPLVVVSMKPPVPVFVLVPEQVIPDTHPLSVLAKAASVRRVVTPKLAGAVMDAADSICTVIAGAGSPSANDGADSDVERGVAVLDEEAPFAEADTALGGGGEEVSFGLACDEHPDTKARRAIIAAASFRFRVSMKLPPRGAILPTDGSMQSPAVADMELTEGGAVVHPNRKRGAKRDEASVIWYDGGGVVRSPSLWPRWQWSMRGIALAPMLGAEEEWNRMTDRVDEALRAVDYDSYVTQDGVTLPQSSAPSVIARLLRLLEIEPGMRIFEVGTGSGFSTALLCELVGPTGRIVSMEVNPALSRRAAERLHAAGHTQAELVTGNALVAELGTGFDRLIAWATADMVPDGWRRAVQPGGWLMVPVQLLPLRGAAPVVKLSSAGGVLAVDGFFPGGFVPLSPSGEWRPDGLGMSDLDAGGLRLSAPGLLTPASRMQLQGLLSHLRPWPSPLRAGESADDLWWYLVARSSQDLVSGVVAGESWGMVFGAAGGDGIALLNRSGEGPATPSLHGGNAEYRERLSGWVEAWRSLGRPGFRSLRGSAVLVSKQGWRIVAMIR